MHLVRKHQFSCEYKPYSTCSQSTRSFLPQLGHLRWYSLHSTVQINTESRKIMHRKIANVVENSVSSNKNVWVPQTILWRIATSTFDNQSAGFSPLVRVHLTSCRVKYIDFWGTNNSDGWVNGFKLPRNGTILTSCDGRCTRLLTESNCTHSQQEWCRYYF